MSCDKLVYDLSSETEGSPNVFVRKDWINILDNQTSNYSSNQSIVDTSQLSNSNKWMSYREAYLEIPLLLTLACSQPGDPTGRTAPGVGGSVGFKGKKIDIPNSLSADATIGLKNWFGQIIHSFTLDYNGTTIIQQTPFINMWNSFKLMTTLSWADVKTQGAHIGFYPDTSTSWHYVFDVPAGSYSPDGDGVSNNRIITSDKAGEFAPFTSSASTLGQSTSNEGYLKRMQYIACDPKAPVGEYYTANLVAATADSEDIIPISTVFNKMWRSYITGAPGAVGVKGFVQYQLMATVYLKHIHSFFNMVPLLKGVYMKMTMNLNQSSATITAFPAVSEPAAGAYLPGGLKLTSVSSAVGGVVPFMVSSSIATDPENTGTGTYSFEDASASGGAPLTYFGGAVSQDYYANISVGKNVLDSTISGIAGMTSGALAQSIYLYVPAYTFNPVFEQAYLSSPVKTVKYTDVYQYQVSGVQGTFNQLITNGIANIKSVLILPFLAKGTSQNGIATGYASYQSPFNPAGCGTTDPLCAINNFNVVVSGQNAIYNTERYTFEHFVNQVYGQNAVNGGLTDGLTSSLINFKDWQSSYCYYYTNVERMLPVEQTVPKSVFIQGVIEGPKTWDLWVFIEYGTQIQIDAITGARV